MESTADRDDELKTTLSFDDLFGDLFQSDKLLPRVETGGLVGDGGKPPLSVAPAGYDRDDDKPRVNLAQFPPFISSSPSPRLRDMFLSRRSSLSFQRDMSRISYIMPSTVTF